MTTVRAGRLVKSRCSPSKRAKGSSQYQGSPPRVSPRAREVRHKPISSTVITTNRNPSIPALSRHLVLLWKCITNVKTSKKSRRFSYIPDGFTKVEITDEPQTPLANRRHAGFWDPPVLPPSPSSPESDYSTDLQVDQPISDRVA